MWSFVSSVISRCKTRPKDERQHLIDESKDPITSRLSHITVSNGSNTDTVTTLPPMNPRIKRIVKKSPPKIKVGLAAAKICAISATASFNSEEFVNFISGNAKDHKSLLGMILGSIFIYAGAETTTLTRFKNATRMPLPYVPTRQEELAQLISQLEQVKRESDQLKEHLRLSMSDSAIQFEKDVGLDLSDSTIQCVISYLTANSTSEQDEKLNSLILDLAASSPALICAELKSPVKQSPRTEFDALNPLGMSASQKAIYNVSIACAVIYSIFGGASARVAVLAILKLGLSLLEYIINTSLSYNDKCDKPRSAEWAIALVTLATALLCAANLLSFYKYNYNRITSEYIYWFLLGKQKRDANITPTSSYSKQLQNLSLFYWLVGGPEEVSLKSGLQSFLGTAMATFGSFYSAKKLLDSLSKAIQTECPPSESESDLTHYLNIAIAVMAATATYAIMRLMTLPAIHKRNTNEAEKSIDKALEILEVSAFTHRRRQMGIFLNAVNNGLATLIAIATIGGEKELRLAPECIVPFVIGALFAVLVTIQNLLATDLEGYIVELLAQVEEKKWEEAYAEYERRHGIAKLVLIPDEKPSHRFFPAMGIPLPHVAREVDIVIQQPQNGDTTRQLAQRLLTQPANDSNTNNAQSSVSIPAKRSPAKVSFANGSKQASYGSFHRQILTIPTTDSQSSSTAPLLSAS
jgi:hypothetical protein